MKSTLILCARLLDISGNKSPSRTDAEFIIIHVYHEVKRKAAAVTRDKIDWEK